jgi:hypothetical protein
MRRAAAKGAANMTTQAASPKSRTSKSASRRPRRNPVYLNRIARPPEDLQKYHRPANLGNILTIVDTFVAANELLDFSRLPPHRRQQQFAAEEDEGQKQQRGNDVAAEAVHYKRLNGVPMSKFALDAKRR